MKVLDLLDLVIVLLSGLLAAAEKAGAVRVVEAVAGALHALREVQGSEVTRQQLESLRITPQW